MGVTHNIKPDELRRVLNKVQNQYDQTIKMAENKQKNSIQKLCNSWTGDKAVTEIRNLVDKLNSYYTDFSGSVNSSYSKLFDSISVSNPHTLSYKTSLGTIWVELLIKYSNNKNSLHTKSIDSLLVVQVNVDDLVFNFISAYST